MSYYQIGLAIMSGLAFLLFVFTVTLVLSNSNLSERAKSAESREEILKKRVGERDETIVGLRRQLDALYETVASVNFRCGKCGRYISHEGEGHLEGCPMEGLSLFDLDRITV